MSEKIKTAVMEIIKAHMDGEDKNTKAVLSDVMATVNELEILEQEPCDKAVSREDKKHIDGFKYWCETNEENGTITIPKFVCDEIVKILDELPPVTQKSETVTEFADRCRECGKMRKGHWIHLRGDMYECSECGKIHTSFEIGECDADYCPNCGAKMESEE